MTKIAFIMPDASMVKAATHAWNLHNEIFGATPDLSYSIDSELSPEMIVSRHNYADVIVSRGGTATMVREHNILTPVVEISIPAADIFDSIRKAVREHGEMEIGVVGTANMVSSLKLRKNPFGFPVKSYTAKSVKYYDLVDAVEEALADGCRMIVGGHQTERYCREKGIPAGLIYSSMESVFHAIT